MKTKALLAGLCLLVLPVTAQAATVGPGGAANGITYDLSISSGALNSLSATFDLHVSGINAITDLEGGRSALNDIAFGSANKLDILSASMAGKVFQTGGLDSGGCNGSGNFFCFNGATAPNTPALGVNSTLDVTFTINLASGNFLAWVGDSPALKVDWSGTKVGNYDNVSLDFVGSVGPTTQISPVPIPAVGTGLPGILAFVMWMLHRNRKKRELMGLPA